MSVIMLDILYMAIINGSNAEAIYSINTENPWMTNYQRYHNTPLYMASMYGRTEIVELLLQKYTEANANQLHWIPKKIKEFSRHNINIDTKNCSGMSALHIASSKGYIQIVKLLLEHRANVNTNNSYGYTPLHEACCRGYYKIVKLLLDYGANCKIKTLCQETALSVACAGISHSTHSNTYVAIVQLLLDYGANINTINRAKCTPLYIASSTKQFEIVELLLDYGANVKIQNHYKETALSIACSCNYVAIAKLLLDHKSNVNTYNTSGDTPLHTACHYGYSEIVKLLLQNEAQINTKNKNGSIPLHEACLQGCVEIVQILLDYNADIECETNAKDTPLHVACHYSYINGGHIEVIKLLLKHGANINAKNKIQQTPLHKACNMAYDREIIKILLDHDAQINSIDSNQNTPLYLACAHGVTSIVEILLQYGANVNIKKQPNNTLFHYTFPRGDNNTTALHYAFKHANLVKLLLNYGVNVDDTAFDQYPLIQTIRNYQNGVIDANYKHSIYWSAMLNYAQRTGEIKEELVGKNTGYDNVVKAIYVKKIFENDEKDSQNIHGISEKEAIEYIHNPFVPLEIKNKLFLNSFIWYVEKKIAVIDLINIIQTEEEKELHTIHCVDPQYEYVFDTEKLTRIDQSCILNKNIELVQLMEDFTNEKFKKLVKGHEYCTHIHHMIMHCKSEKSEIFKKLSVLYQVDSTDTNEETLEHIFSKLVEYAGNFAEQHPEEGSMLQYLCLRFAKNKEIFQAVKQHYKEFDNFTSVTNLTEYEMLVTAIEGTGVYDNAEEKEKSLNRLRQWRDDHKDVNQKHDFVEEFRTFLKDGYEYELTQTGTLFDISHFDNDSIPEMMTALCDKFLVDIPN